MPTIKNRRASESQWETLNPVLAAGEIGYEFNTNRFKIGDGVSSWSALPYYVDSSILETGRLSVTSMNNSYERVMIPERRDLAMLVGSSTMAGLAVGLQNALSERGVSTSHNSSAIGSWQVSHMGAAVGTRPLVAEEFTIPSVGSVTIKPTNMTEANNTTARIEFAGSFLGVVGVLSSPAGSGTWTFTRDAQGDPMGVPAGVPYVPTVPAPRRRALAILNIGKNTLTTSRPGWDWRQCVASTESMDDYFGGPDGRVLIMGHFVNTTTPAVSTTRDRIKATNDYLADKFGDRFFDLGGYLAGSQVWVDTGITPTQTDLDEQALGNKPPSLSGDNGHMNAAGYNAVVNRIIAKLDELGWIPPAPPATWSVIATDNFNQIDGVLDGRTTTTGNLTWGTPASATSLDIVSNKVVTSSGTRKNTIDPGSNDVKMGVTLTSLGSTPATRGMRVMGRVQNLSTYYFVAPRVSATVDGLSIWKNVNGTLSALTSNSAASFVPKNGDRLEIGLDGSTITAHLNGVEKLSVVDTELVSGLVGIEIASGECSLDDLTVSLKA